jgi:hypothetical protein
MSTPTTETNPPAFLSNPSVGMVGRIRFTGKRLEEHQVLVASRVLFSRKDYSTELKKLQTRQHISNTLIKRNKAKKVAEAEHNRLYRFVKEEEKRYAVYGITSFKFGPYGEKDIVGQYTGINAEASTETIREVVNTARREFRKAFPVGGTLQVKFLGRKRRGQDGFDQQKNFDSFPADNVDDFIDNVMKFTSITTMSNEDKTMSEGYEFMIVYIIVKAIRPLAGGCRNRTKHIKVDGVEVIDHQSRGKNNCFFTCCLEEFGSKYTDLTRLSEKFCNTIRSKYKIPDDALITSDKASEIYFTEFNLPLCIMNENQTAVGGHEEADKKLMLINEHYVEFIGSLADTTVCSRCKTAYKTKHSPQACAKRQTYYAKQICKQNTRFVKMKTEKQTYDSYKEVLHYDIETHTKNPEKRHTPYIVGCVYYDIAGVKQYKTFKGEDCMTQFYNALSTEELVHINFINAFKGSIFDHYYLLGVMWEDNTESTDSLLMNNGRILRAEVKDRVLIDLGNHLTGTLRENLISAGCAIQKGDIDHNTTNAWHLMSKTLRDDVELYLEKDVLGLCELYEIINADMFKSEGVNICNFLTTSHCAYTLWAEKYLSHPVYIPTPDDDSFIRQAVYGGRCYKNKSSYKSEQYDDIKNGLIKSIDEVDDFMVYTDVVSLYPTSMKENYPIGAPIKTSVYQENKMGIYKVRYTTNKTLLTPVLPRRENNALKWDLLDGEGVYTSVDIETAKRYGYTFEIDYGMYWEESAKLFDEYIEKFYQKKQNAVKDTAPYQTAKLYLNGLYGKMIQRPIYTKTFYPINHSELMEILYTHILVEIEQVGSRLVVIGHPRNGDDIVKCVSKPTQCGAFILSYSRAIMMGHIANTNPENTMEKLFHYTDTDSLMVHNSCMEKIKLGKKLGDLDNDLGAGKKLIRGIWVAPKLYMIEYCYEENGKIVIKHKMRGKGLNSKNLSIELYEHMNGGNAITNVAEFQMKRINVKRNKSEEEKQIFSVYHTHKTDINASGKIKLEKTVNTKQWAGRIFVEENVSYPYGHNEIIDDDNSDDDE